ncbi:CU044_5270 family protein [Actinomadura viridis]|uniref:CU044_5270 family protein n=1 Tax=Actinomadura viridis TaxID=58110 RepID=UPI0036A912BF
MDELDALRRMRTELTREEDPDTLAARIGWRPGNEPRTPAPARSRARPRFTFPLVSVAVAGAVAAGAVAVLALPQDTVPGEGGRSVTPARGTPTRGTPARGDVLLVAATNAEKRTTGKYWHTSRVEGKIYAVGASAADHYKVESRVRYGAWTDRNGRATLSNEDLPFRPWTVEDRRKWEAAGSPGVIEFPTPEGTGVLFMRPSGAQAPHVRKDRDVKRFLGLTPRQLADLPTGPEELRNALLDLEENWHAYSPDARKEPMRALRGEARVRALSDAAGTLLATAPAPPKVRAAAFRMLAALPGVTAGGEAADPLGRTGTVISLPLETTVPLGLYTAPKQLGTYRRQWIIDPEKGTLLAVQDLVAKPPSGSRRLPTGDDGRPRSLKAAEQPDRFHRPGELSMYEVYEVTEWTDTEPG